MCPYLSRLAFCHRRLAAVLVLGFCGATCRAQAAAAQPIAVTVSPANCGFTIGGGGSHAPILKADIAAKVNYNWLHSSDYPKCTIAESDGDGAFGSAHQWVVEYSGLDNKPNLGYILRGYRDKPFIDLQATVKNLTGHAIEVEDIRTIEASAGIDLGGTPALDRVLSDSYSEDRPALRIHDLGDSPQMMQRAFGSQLIYNRQSHSSFFVGALSSDRFLTIVHLHVGGTSSDPTIQSYEVDSTGTTEITREFSLSSSPDEDRIELSLPIAPGESLAGERLLAGLDSDPHRQLEAYGSFIRELHHPRPAEPTPMGWWSWTAYYFGLNEGAALTNAQWLAQNLKPLGYRFFHIDEGYQYSRGDYTTPDAALFPHGINALEKQVTALGLTPGIWTAPFEVGERSSVYQDHPDWLVHNAKGKPIPIGKIDNKEPLYVLDVTHPEAQRYLRQTYTVMARDWGVRYFKLDFMDDSAIEGYYFKPHTTALQAQRIGLALIRDAVGDSVLLDKDGSAMLNPVGYVDEGRVSQDTGHTFSGIKEAASGIAARYYMNHNFYTTDPDAFSVSTQTLVHQWHGGTRPLTLEEARIAIMLSAVSGGMFEIGDDLPTLGADPERLKLVKNPDLLDIARIGRASAPVDLMDYLPEDEQPSIFYLREDPDQSILSVFNWTGNSRTHLFQMSALGFPAGHTTVRDVFTGALVMPGQNGVLIVQQPANSVRVFKIENSTPTPPHIALSAKSTPEGQSGDELAFSLNPIQSEYPALAYKWDFGDGVTAESSAPSHAYTSPGTYLVHVKVAFLGGSVAECHFNVTIKGVIDSQFDPARKRRLAAPD
jgi:hypothetical protein